MENTLVLKNTLKSDSFTVNALTFIPKKENYTNHTQAVFTHGYTSSKHSIVNWSTRLSEAGIASTIFDLPGHFLGSHNDFKSFETFTENTIFLFFDAYKEMIKEIKSYYPDTSTDNLFIGGHSLGALLSLKAIGEDKRFEGLNHQNISVGFGVNLDVKTHLFDSPFYKNTLNIRRQLVSEHLHPDKILPWIKEQKNELKISDKKINILTGEDDIVVGKEGSENLKKILDKKNEVNLIKPKKLPHHHPDLAASYIYSIIKNELKK